MLHTKFVEIGSKVLEKKHFERFFNIYGHNDHLGHVTSIMSFNFNFLVPTSLHPIFGSEWSTGF